MSTLENTQWTVDTIRTLYKVSITCRVSPSRRHPGVTTLQHDTADCTPLTPRMSDGRARWCRDRGRNSSELRSCDGLTPRLANANQQLSSVQFTVGLGCSFTCLFLFILFAKFDAAILSCLPAFGTPHSIHTPKWALVRTQTLYKRCDMFHSINCERQFEFSFQFDNWILQHIQSIVLLSISGRVFVVVHSSSSVYTMQDWESNHLWFPRAKKPNIWVGVSWAAAALHGHDGNKLNWFLHNKYSEGAQSTGGGIYNLFHHLPLQAAGAALHRQGPLFSSMYRCLYCL